MFIEVLCEGESDEPAVREVLTRRFRLVEGEHFRIHPHRGKGKLREKKDQLKKPDPGNDGLLHHLPITLKNMGKQSAGQFEVAAIVLVDADRDDCKELKASLVEMYSALPSKPQRCLFRIAVEETESWFIADVDAIKQAFPRADWKTLAKIEKDKVCGAWQRLAEAVGLDPADCAGGEKVEWATAISPHLDLKDPKSPSLRAFLMGVAKLVGDASAKEA